MLEASAGTGKTFTIAALAARYVAEGHARLPELLLVTFGRAATQELRERVRERLVSAERGLRDPAAARAGDDADVWRCSRTSPDDEVALRRRRLATALADFDAATIATTHGFCQQMLTGLGIAGDAEPDATFVETIDDLVVEVVDDLYLRKFAAPAPARRRSTGRGPRLARRAVDDPQARLEPAGATRHRGDAAGLRDGRAAEVERRKRRRGLLDYDDLLTRLPTRWPTRPRRRAQRLRARYRVVLVDEFQDTDPVQWDILRPSTGTRRWS